MTETISEILRIVINRCIERIISEDYDNFELLLIRFPELVLYDDEYLLQYISDVGDITAIKLMVKYGADINYEGYYIWTSAAYRKQDDLLQYLFDTYDFDIENVKRYCGYNYLKQFQIEHKNAL